MSEESMNPGKPRKGPYAEDPGAYEIAIRVKNPVLDPGQILIIEQYFVGYGKISGGKVGTYISDEIFDENESNVEVGMTIVGGKVLWGGDIKKVTNLGFTMGLTNYGVRFKEEEHQTIFFDISRTGSPTPQLFSETTQGKAPCTLRLKIKKDIVPGPYYLSFHFTYHDGKSWKSNSKKVEFKVRNFLERYSVQIGLLAFTGTLLGLIKYLLVPSIIWGLEVMKYLWWVNAWRRF